MVMPRSRSMSIESRYCSRIRRGSTAPVSSRMRSDRVDLPWSTWLMMEKLRMTVDGEHGGTSVPKCDRRVLILVTAGRRAPAAAAILASPEARDLRRIRVGRRQRPPTGRHPEHRRRTSSGKHQEPDQAQPPDHQASGPQQGGPLRAADPHQAGHHRHRRPGPRTARRPSGWPSSGSTRRRPRASSTRTRRPTARPG